MAVELTEALRSDERKLADPSGACLAAAMVFWEETHMVNYMCW